MEEKKVADYFVIAGLPDEPELLEDTILNESGHLKGYTSKSPITDIGVLFPSLGEEVPEGYELLEYSPTNLPANLNHGSIRTPECYICYRRGKDRPPLVDIGVMYEGKERLMADAEKITETVGGRIANVNNSTSKTFITYRRASPSAPCNSLVVMDICVIIASKGEYPPHAFCMIGKNLNKGLVGSDVYLCYKKSMNRPPLLAFKPEVLIRYPTSDREDIEFPVSVPLFCMPMGVSLEMWPKEALSPKPLFSTFVLTVADATDKVYGSAVTFYESYNPDNISDDQLADLGWRKDVSQDSYGLYVNKSICLLSRWPFSDSFERWLLFILDLYQNQQPLPVPIERYVVQLLYEVPFPEPRILLQLSWDELLCFWSGWEGARVSGASYRALLLNLGPENTLLLLALALTEQKILLHSLRPDTLTAVAEAVTGLLFPFKWQCPYIPLCPLGLAEVLHAPLPYLIGVDSRFFDLYEPPPDVSCVDLDTNTLSICDSQRHITTKLLPKKQAKQLRQNLEDLYTRIRPGSPTTQASLTAFNGEPTTSLDRDFRRRKKEATFELEISEAFLKFTAGCFRGYTSYLLPITRAPTVGTTDPHALFNMDAFLTSRDKTDQSFFVLLMRTQMFTRFIEERSLACDPALALFDEFAERGGRLMPPRDTSDRTIVIPPPTPSGNNHLYRYPVLMLDEKLLKKSDVINCNKTSTSNSQEGVGSLGGTALSYSARRTPHEVRQGIRSSRAAWTCGTAWSRCLLAAVYTSHYETGGQGGAALLERASRAGIACEQVCWRVALLRDPDPRRALQLLATMTRAKVRANALTYSLYNRCLLEASWPMDSPRSGVLAWNRLKVALRAVTAFKASIAAGRSDDSVSEVDDRDFTKGACQELPVSIIKGPRLAVPTHSSAGLLITGHPSNPDLRVPSRRNSFANDKPWAKTTLDKNNDRKSNTNDVSQYGGDARILQMTGGLSNKTSSCSRTLSFPDNLKDDQFNASLEPIKPSPLKAKGTPVLRNDPLGALEPRPTISPKETAPPASVLTSPPSQTHSLTPKLFQDPELFGDTPKLHRSETAPAGSVTSSLVNLGNSFKLSFGSGSLAGKKSNEILQSGLSSLKLAATSVAKKFDEMKEVISANSTPVKGALGNATTVLSNLIAEEDSSEEEYEEIDGEEFDPETTNLSHREAEEATRHLYEGCSTQSKNSKATTTIRAWSRTVCVKCGAALYDDDIMAGWGPHHSDLNTRCPHCGASVVPQLSLQVEHSGQETTESVSVPYLNPLVLRKELETILQNEGDRCFRDKKFVDSHPIIYWNLVWYMERANISSHFSSLCSKTPIVCDDTDGDVRVLCYWEWSSDEPSALYRLWRTPRSHTLNALLINDTPHDSVAKQIITGLRNNDLTSALQQLVDWRTSVINNNKYPSLYRDVMFLAQVALGEGKIDATALQREYSRALNLLGEKARPVDCPPTPSALLARLYFRPLALPR